MSSNISKQKNHIVKLISLTSDTTPSIKKLEHSIKV